MKLALSSAQYKYLARFCREIAQADIVGSFAARLLPSAVGLEASLSGRSFLRLFVTGLTILGLGVILEKRGEVK